MTFLKIRKSRETLRNKTTLFALVAAAVSVGYVLFLAILAPEQLAEATTAATDLVCSGCVGTSDIANSAVTTAKIGSGQVANSDLGTGAVTTGKISDTNGVQSVDIVDGQVGNADLGPSAVTSPKIGDFQVGNGDLGTDAVTSTKIKNGEVKTEDLANDAVKPNVQRVQGPGTSIAPGETGHDEATCPSAYTLTAGGYHGGAFSMQVYFNFPFQTNTWFVAGFNEGDVSRTLTAYAICTGPSP